MMMNPYAEYAECTEVERTIMLIDEVGWAAPPYALEVR
jgi:hypothetical protein